MSWVQSKQPPDFPVVMTVTFPWRLAKATVQGNESTFPLLYFPKQRVHLCQTQQALFLCGGCVRLLCYLPPRSG